MASQHFDRIMAALKRRYKAPAASSKDDPWEVLLFTLLSARTRDSQTEVVFRKLLQGYPTISSLADARLVDVQEILKTIGLYRGKARNVIALAKKVMAEHDGKVPRGMTELVDLPGVGRKTASCVMVYAYGKPAIAVDTHVHRIVNRLGWTRTNDAGKTEVALRDKLPEKHWLDINRVMVQFGRDICKPGLPRCGECPVRAWCAFPKKNLSPKKI